MSNKTVKYKNAEDHVFIKTVPENWTGYDNPTVEVTVKRPLSDFQERALKSVMAEAILRYSALTQTPLKAEIKP